MKINNKNKQIINTKEVSMHDDIITNFTFDRVKKILELHRGEVSVQSQAEKGCIFIVRLPV